MEGVKHKILLENSIDRSFNSPNWGTITASTFYINVFLTQSIDDMGLFTDIEYFSADTANPTPVDYTILTTKLISSGYTFPFMANLFVYPTTGLTETDLVTLRLASETESSFYNYINLPVTGVTDSKIDDLRSYDQLNRYRIGFDMEAETYTNYKNISVNGVSRIVSASEPKKYVFDAVNDPTIGTTSQVHGLQYIDYSANTQNILVDNVIVQNQLTNFRFIGEGQNETNISLSALTKEEYLFGIISTPEVKNDVFIDRGVTSVMDIHLRLSEIKNLGQLSRYGNGFYNLTKQ
jgi:hypothetical protein